MYLVDSIDVTDSNFGWRDANKRAFAMVLVAWFVGEQRDLVLTIFPVQKMNVSSSFSRQYS